MSLHRFKNQSLQNYPKIQIDRGSVIKPCVADQVAADHFIDKPVSGWKKVVYDVWHEGFFFLLRYTSSLHVPANANKYYVYLIKTIKYLAILLLHIHRLYLCIYGYFYPYSLMTLDEVCDEFSRCPKWTESVIRAFSWHPNHDRCAIAICNDYIYVYQGTERIRVLRHNHQRKIVDMAWQPSNKEVLVVATQTNIIIWRVTDNHANMLKVKEGLIGPSLSYLSPVLHFNIRERDVSSNGAARQQLSYSENSVKASEQNFILLERPLPAPIVSIQFDKSSDKLYACSPNSCRIAIIDIEGILASKDSPAQQDQKITYLRKGFGQGITRLLWSPEGDRLATSTTTSFLRVFEPFNWTSNKWSTQKLIVQDMIWTKPSGRMLLIANKSEPFLYVLPFLDDSQANDVGGNKSLMRALDLSEKRSEHGTNVGGRVQTFAWDKNGKRLAISFKDNPESIILFKTVEKPTVEFHQMGIIQSENSSYPLLMEFHDKYKNGSLLTICWSDGNCQHLPLTYLPQEQNLNGSLRNDSMNGSFNNSFNSFNGTASSPKTPRSMTNFCHVSGNNSISSYPASLKPINKIQHQTTLFSLSSRSSETDNNCSNQSEMGESS